MLYLLAAPGQALRWALRQLPGPLLRRLDGWAQREAQRRAARRGAAAARS